jgi:hypothetical protein
MRSVPSTNSIEAEGLKNYLNRVYGNYGGYDEFVKRCELGEPKTVIGRAFGEKDKPTDRHTIDKWIKLYNKNKEKI